MSDVIDYKIFGDDLQLVEIELDPGETVRAEVGTMTYMEDGIAMQTSTGGGLMKGLMRAVTGESFFIVNFNNTGKAKSRGFFRNPCGGNSVRDGVEWEARHQRGEYYGIPSTCEHRYSARYSARESAEH